MVTSNTPVSKPRRAAVIWGTLGFLVLLGAAFLSPLRGPWFAGAAGIEKDLSAEVEAKLQEFGLPDGSATVDAAGRDITVTFVGDAADRGAFFGTPGATESIMSVPGVRSVSYEGVGLQLDVGDGEPGTELASGDDTESDDATAEESGDEPDEATSSDGWSSDSMSAEDLDVLLEGIDTDAIEFVPGTTSLVPEASGALDDIVASLAGVPPGAGLSIEVQGHTDDSDDPDFNVLLSSEQAEVVMNSLVQRGLAPNLVTAVGLGSSEPIADNSSAEGRAVNNRIELVTREGNN